MYYTKTPPLVSIILPFYNAAGTLANAIESIINQTYEKIELILVDNNSSDQSHQIAQRFATGSSNIHLIQEKHQGVVFATMAGYKVSTGEYISRMDADDIADVTKIEKQIVLFRSQPSMGVVSCLVRNIQHPEIPGDGIEYYVDWTNKKTESEDIENCRFIESPIINPTVLIKRSVIEEYGFYSDGDYPEDYELWLRYISKGVKCAKVTEYLLSWNDSNTRLTRNDPKYDVEAFYRIKLQYFYNDILQQSGYKKIYVWGAGRLTRRRVEMLFDFGVKIDTYIDFEANASINTISYKQLCYDEAILILSFVANRGARDKIRVYLDQLGYTEGDSYWCLA